MHHTIGQ